MIDAEREVLMVRAEERADAVVWLVALGHAASNGSPSGKELAELLGCEPATFAKVVNAAAHGVFTGEHAGAAALVGPDLSFIFGHGVSDAAGMEEAIFESMREQAE